MMKKEYVKPSIQFVELRPEERLANGCVGHWIGPPGEWGNNDCYYEYFVPAS